MTYPISLRDHLRPLAAINGNFDDCHFSSNPFHAGQCRPVGGGHLQTDSWLSVLSAPCHTVGPDRTQTAKKAALSLGLLHDQVTVSVTRPDWPVWS